MCSRAEFSLCFLILNLIHLSDGIRSEGIHHDVSQQPQNTHSGALDDHRLHRAGDPSNAPKWKAQDQAASTSPQSLAGGSNGQAYTAGADRPPQGLVADELLLGVGSQFANGARRGPPQS